MKTFERVLLGLVALATAAAMACGGGGGGGGNDTTGQPDAVGDPSGDQTPGDPGEEPGTDPSGDPKPDPTPDPVGDPSPEVPPTKCSPACDYAAGKYCDEGAATPACKDIACALCWLDADCGEGGKCLDVAFDGGVKRSVCSKACAGSADCGAGFKCDAGTAMCVPLALCAIPGCGGEGKLGDPCDLAGVNAGCAPCGQGLTCIGSQPIADATCEFDTDCIGVGFAVATNPDCVEGKCGRSYCSQKCGAGCPEGFVGMVGGISCWCTPAAGTAAGGACPFDTLHDGTDNCGGDMACLGIPADAKGTACGTTEDCVDAGYDAKLNPECVGGRCGISFCSPRCDKDGKCPEDFGPFEISDGQGGKVCFCQPKDTGDSQPGAACPFGDVNKDADFCVAEATCLGIEPATDTTACTTPDDCKGVFPGATVCTDGHCGTSFCSVPCGEGDTCEPGFDPIQVGQEPDIACFCAPREVGTSGPGDACPFGTVNAGAEACDAQTWCLGMPADAESLACANDEDCPEAVFAGNPDCVDGRCGTSFCAPKCADGKCEPGFQPIDIDGVCLCQPRVVGTAVAGDPCPFGNVNLDAEACNLETSCLGIPAAAETPACVAPTDCPKVDAEGNDLLGTPDCKDGHCGYSFCAAECDAEGACLAGFHPIDVDGTCYCAPGEAAPAEPQPDAAVTPDEPVTADDPTAPDAAVTPDVPAVEDVAINPDAPIDTPARGIDTP